MGRKKLTSEDIEPGVLYVSRNELIERTGVPYHTINRDIKKGMLEALEFSGRTYFHPDTVTTYEILVNCGLRKGNK